MESPDTITDAELLLAWSDGGCQASFRALVEKYLGLVQGVALRRTGNPVLAGDIAQAVFARLAAKASRLASQPSLAGWLRHCAWCGEKQMPRPLVVQWNRREVSLCLR